MLTPAVGRGLEVEEVNGGALIDGDHGRWPLLQRADQQKVIREAVSRGTMGECRHRVGIVHNVCKAIEEDVIVYVQWLCSYDWCSKAVVLTIMEWHQALFAIHG